MHSSVWGPHCWKIIHQSAYLFQPSDIEKMRTKSFFYHIYNALPCGICKHHFQQIVQSTDFNEVLKTRESFIKWTIDIHNRVNRRLGKAQFSKRDADKIYIKTTPQEYIQNLYYLVYYFTKGKSIFVDLQNIVGYAVHHFPNNELIKKNPKAFDELLYTKNNNDVLQWAEKQLKLFINPEIKTPVMQVKKQLSEKIENSTYSTRFQEIKNKSKGCNCNKSKTTTMTLEKQPVTKRGMQTFVKKYM